MNLIHQLGLVGILVTEGRVPQWVYHFCAFAMDLVCETWLAPHQAIPVVSFAVVCLNHLFGLVLCRCAVPELLAARVLCQFALYLQLFSTTVLLFDYGMLRYG